MNEGNIRNIALIAHVDHGKTSMVDCLFRETNEDLKEANRLMDSGDLEKERGITILAKNTAIYWKDTRINIVDTPGHADFGGEVERVLSMVDSVLLLVDAAEGPMPQTRFVTRKAFEKGLKPIVVINKVDRTGADPDRAIDLVFDMFVELDANEEQLDFPIVYASALLRKSGLELDSLSDNMQPLLNVILENAPPPQVEIEGPFQMQVSLLGYDTFKGVIGIGRVHRGKLSENTAISVIDSNGDKRSSKVSEILHSDGLELVKINEACAGDIVSVTGIDPLHVSDTLCDNSKIEALPPLLVDEPTLSVIFMVNTSPVSGQDGKFLTSRQILDRLEREALHNVALRVAPGETPEQFRVSGRGELHLTVLIETMRREGYELSIGRPEVITKVIDDREQEPFENLVIDIDLEHQGSVMEEMGRRKALMKNMEPTDKRVKLEYEISTRGLLGFRTMFMSMTSGSGIMTHAFSHYGEMVSGVAGGRLKGVLISSDSGEAVGYALFNLQPRGQLFVNPGDFVYEGMIIGEHSRDNDLTVNPLKGKKLTNIRASGTDENIILTPPRLMSLEQMMQYIQSDELLEVTPNFLRLRKKYLKESDRKRYASNKDR